MILIKNKVAIGKMDRAGKLLLEIFDQISGLLKPGITTAFIDAWIDEQQKKRNLVSATKGYRGYKHASCISVNEVVVHGVPSETVVLALGDLVKVDICASWNGYCADMARSFFVGEMSEKAKKLVEVAQQALDKGIAMARPGNHVSDISFAIQQEVETHGFGVIRDFAGHGIGRNMHEDPEILNYGKPGKGPILRAGMAFAIEPMITLGDYKVCIERDGWTVRTADRSLAAHVEDTIIITNDEPNIITRHNV